MRVCLGGTFNCFHKGHRKLIDVALQKAGKNGLVFIGISSESLMKNRSHIKPYDFRRDNIIFYLNEKKNELPTVIIEPIDTIEGPTLSMDFDAIIVSNETEENARKINQKRKQKNMSQMKIITIPIIRAEDNKKISSSRIINNEIDTEGHVL